MAQRKRTNSKIHWLTTFRDRGSRLQISGGGAPASAPADNVDVVPPAPHSSVGNQMEGFLEIIVAGAIEPEVFFMV